MKKILFIWVVVLAVGTFFAVYFNLPAKVYKKTGAGENKITQKQTVIQLCQVNATLAKRVEAILKKNDDAAPYYIYDEKGKVVSLVPNSFFFLIVGELVKRDGESAAYAGLAEELVEDNRMLWSAMEHLNPKPGKK